MRRASDADFADELESHLQFHIDDNIRAGMSPARRHALIKLGGLDGTGTFSVDIHLKIVLVDAVVVVGAGSIAGSVLAAVLLLLMGVGLLASLRPARRAATTDPIVALRHD